MLCLSCRKRERNHKERMCDVCSKVTEDIERSDLRSGKTKHPNYGYTESGMNLGLGVYIRDKEHFKRVEAELEAEEGIRNVAR